MPICQIRSFASSIGRAGRIATRIWMRSLFSVHGAGGGKTVLVQIGGAPFVGAMCCAFLVDPRGRGAIVEPTGLANGGTPRDQPVSRTMSRNGAATAAVAAAQRDGSSDPAQRWKTGGLVWKDSDYPHLPCIEELVDLQLTLAKSLLARFGAQLRTKTAPSSISECRPRVWHCWSGCWPGWRSNHPAWSVADANRSGLLRSGAPRADSTGGRAADEGLAAWTLPNPERGLVCLAAAGGSGFSLYQLAGRPAGGDPARNCSG